MHALVTKVTLTKELCPVIIETNPTVSCPTQQCLQSQPTVEQSLMVHALYNFRRLTFNHSKMVEGIALKIIASRPPSMAQRANRIS
jgi:hypothetical protein